MTDPKKLLFVSDLDGTLLDREGQLSNDSVKRLNKLIDKGLNFTIATARNYDSAYPLLKGLNINVIGNSFIISIAIKILIKKMLFFKYGKCIFLKVLNLE